MIGAGTNNARIAGMLRNLSSYYYKEASLLFCVSFSWNLFHSASQIFFLSLIFIFIFYFFKGFCFNDLCWPLVQVRIAQGLVLLGKGLLTLAPYHSERFLLSP